MSTNTLARWMELATVREKEELAERVGSSYAYVVFHLPKTERKNWREPKPALAAGIEEATIAMARASKGRLPVVYRTELNSACRGCKFAARCLGDKAIAAEFEVLGE